MTTNTVPGISALQCVISSLRDTAHLSDEEGELTDQLRELRDWALSTAAQPPREDASYESMNLAAMVLSDCGHSSNYTPLLERVAGRIDRHVERLLTAQRADLTRRSGA